MIVYRFTSVDRTIEVVFLTDSFGNHNRFLITERRGIDAEAILFGFNFFKVGIDYHKQEFKDFATDNGYNLEIFDNQDLIESLFADGSMNFQKVLDNNSIIGGDGLSDPATAYYIGTEKFVDGETKLLIIHGSFNGLAAMWVWDLTVNVITRYDKDTTVPGNGLVSSGVGINNIDLRCYSVMYNPKNKTLYMGGSTHLWAYDTVTKEGKEIEPYEVGIVKKVRSLYLDLTGDYIYAAFDSNLPLYTRKYDLVNGGFTTIGQTVDSGEARPFSRTDSYVPNKNHQKAIAWGSAYYGWIHTIEGNIGKEISAASTGAGGTYEVTNGVGLLSNEIEKGLWFYTKDGRELILFGKWDASDNGGIWVYEEATNTGKNFSVTSTSSGGENEVNGDPLPNNIVYSMGTFGDILVVGFSSGFWLYDFETNTGQLLTTVSTAPGGDYELIGDPLPTNASVDTYTKIYSLVNDMQIFPLSSGGAKLWVRSPKVIEF